jgi:hypothetical protein
MQNDPNKTAKWVSGLRVVKDEPYRSPYAKDRRNGEGLLQPQTRVLTLENGHTVFGCQHCPYTSENVHSIRPHLNRHRGDKPNRVPTVGELKSMSAADLLRDINRVAELEASVEQWKARALKAEKTLETLRNAIRAAK